MKKYFKFIGRRKSKTPIVIQMDMTECGAAALASILAYYGTYVSLEKMREVCEISRYGCRADSLLRAARSYGLEAQAVKAELEDLKTVKLPIIVHWEFNHFIVLEEITDDTIYINDPASGHRGIDIDTFNKCYTGIALLFELEKSFKKQGEKFSLYRGLKSYISDRKKEIAYLILASFALILPTIVFATISKVFIDNILSQSMYSWLKPLLLALALVAIFRVSITWLQQYHLLKLRLLLNTKTTYRFINYLTSLPMKFFQQRFTGDLIERFSANDRIIQVMSNDFITQVVGIFSMFIYGILLFVISWQLSLVVISFISLNIIIFWIMTPYLEEAGRVFLQQRGKLQGLQMSNLRMIETIKAFGNEQASFNRYADTHAKTINIQLKALRYQQILSISAALITGTMNVGVLGLGCYLIIRGNLSVGSLVAYQFLLMSFQTPISGLINFGDQLQKLRGDFHRLNDVYNHSVDERYQISKSNVELTNGSVEIKGLTFGYNSIEKPLLQDIHIKIGAKEKVGIVGKTGCGKSTLAKLIVGLYAPNQGEILFDDVSLNNIDQTQFSQHVSFVAQETGLFQGTVRQNISLYDENISDATLLKSLKEAEILEVLNSRSQAYCLDLMIEENGANFSAGQRQRIEIAYGLAKKAKVLILDEATANLDLELESKIIHNIFQRDQTTIFISHRLSVLQKCDNIIVLGDGKVLAEGNHEYLMVNCKYYSDLFQLDEGVTQ